MQFLYLTIRSRTGCGKKQLINMGHVTRMQEFGEYTLLSINEGCAERCFTLQVEETVDEIVRLLNNTNNFVAEIPS